MISGLRMLGLIAVIHPALGRAGPSGGSLAWAFAGLCLVALASRVWSQAMLVRLSQGTVSRMGRGLCRRVLDAPLKHLEEIGPHRILASLTGDVQVIAQALNGVP